MTEEMLGNRVRDHIPLEQGLRRLTDASPAVGQTSETIFH